MHKSDIRDLHERDIHYSLVGHDVVGIDFHPHPNHPHQHQLQDPSIQLTIGFTAASPAICCRPGGNLDQREAGGQVDDLVEGKAAVIERMKVASGRSFTGSLLKLGLTQQRF
jgi:hypothetical protein